MEKYVIESKFENTRCFLEVACENREPYFFINRVDSLTPYTEPDLEQVRKEAYDKGYDDATAEIGSDEQAIAEKAYQKGLSDAWECTRKIVGMHSEERRKIFGQNLLQIIFGFYSEYEAIEKIRQYEQEQEEIQVGDEVISRNKTAVVTEITDRYVRIMYSDGSSYALFSKGVVKTGRHFPEIAEVLQKMKES